MITLSTNKICSILAGGGKREHAQQSPTSPASLQAMPFAPWSILQQWRPETQMLESQGASRNKAYLLLVVHLFPVSCCVNICPPGMARSRHLQSRCSFAEHSASQAW